MFKRCWGITRMLMNSKGFTLVEMLITMALSVIVMLSIVSIYGTMINRSHTTLKAIQLNQELNNAFILMGKTIRRAGFWGDANSLGVNPFTSSGTGLQINNAQDCILFSFDANGDGILPSVNDSSDERYGFRLINNTLQYRESTSQFDCTAQVTDWTDLTDSNQIEVTQLNFTHTPTALDLDGNGPGTATINLHHINISLTARLTSDTSITQSFNQVVRVANDVYQN